MMNSEWPLTTLLNFVNYIFRYHSMHFAHFLLQISIKIWDSYRNQLRNFDFYPWSIVIFCIIFHDKFANLTATLRRIDKSHDFFSASNRKFVIFSQTSIDKFYFFFWQQADKFHWVFFQDWFANYDIFQYLNYKFCNFYRDRLINFVVFFSLHSEKIHDCLVVTNQWNSWFLFTQQIYKFSDFISIDQEFHMIQSKLTW